MLPVHAHLGWPVHSQVTVLCQLRKGIPFSETPAAPGGQQGADPPTSCVRDQRPAPVGHLLPSDCGRGLSPGFLCYKWG